MPGTVLHIGLAKRCVLHIGLAKRAKHCMEKPGHAFWPTQYFRYIHYFINGSSGPQSRISIPLFQVSKLSQGTFIPTGQVRSGLEIHTRS